MKLCGVIFAIVCSVMAAPYERVYEVYDLEKAPELFDKFVKDYDRSYKDEADREVHYEAFVETLKSINKLNAESDSATFGINKFSDYTKEEQKAMFGLRLP